MFALSLVAICVVLGAVGQVLMKTGMSQVGQISGLGKLVEVGTLCNMFTNLHIVAGLLLYAAASILWLAALSNLDISLAYPLLSLAYVLAAVLGLVFLKEDITLLRWGGIVLVIAGCFLVVRS